MVMRLAIDCILGLGAAMALPASLWPVRFETRRVLDGSSSSATLEDVIHQVQRKFPELGGTAVTCVLRTLPPARERYRAALGLDDSDWRFWRSE